MINETQVIALGFSDKQARVYLALLELGPSTVSEVSRRAGINRTTGYDILEMLVSEGLVSSLGKGPIMKYTAESPQNLISYFQNRIKRDRGMLEETKRLLPEFQSLYRKKARPAVKFYEGKEGMKRAYEDTLNSKGPILGYACSEPVEKFLPGYLPDYIKRRVAKKIFGKMIAPDTSGIRKMIENDKKELRESRLVPKEQLDLSIEINIYDDKVMIVSWEENLGILIESDKIAKAQKDIFELAWKAAERPQLK